MRYRDGASESCDMHKYTLCAFCFAQLPHLWNLCVSNLIVYEAFFLRRVYFWFCHHLKPYIFLNPFNYYLRACELLLFVA
jgi:hypothetical protein